MCLCYLICHPNREATWCFQSVPTAAAKTEFCFCSLKITICSTNLIDLFSFTTGKCFGDLLRSRSWCTLSCQVALVARNTPLGNDGKLENWEGKMGAYVQQSPSHSRFRVSQTESWGFALYLYFLTDKFKKGTAFPMGNEKFWVG